ncbi:hypothetical protein SeLEV6574_g04442 [Synchytrium endobioticum]|nr:hypothetical protein SeLEV6574_g04442 [Synchytrium endobioticum]
MAPAAYHDHPSASVSTPTVMDELSPNRIFVRIKRKREDAPLDYIVWNDAHPVAEDSMATPTKKVKTFKQASSPQIFMLAETVHGSGSLPHVNGLSLQSTLSTPKGIAIQAHSELYDKLRLKDKLAQFMISGANAASHQYVDESEEKMQIDGIDEPVTSPKALNMLAKSMKSSLTIRDGKDSDEEEGDDDNNDNDNDSYVYDIYYLDPNAASPIGRNGGSLHMVFGKDRDLYSDDEAENEMYDDDDDSNAEDRPQNDYPDEENFGEVDSQAEICSHDEEDEEGSSDDEFGERNTDSEDDDLELY